MFFLALKGRTQMYRSDPLAADAAVHAMNAYRTAEAETREVLGAGAAMAFDSAADVYRVALARMGIETRSIAPPDFAAVFRACRRARRDAGRPLAPIAMDSTGASGFAGRFPDAVRIGHCY
jgi:hypothetical protein